MPFGVLAPWLWLYVRRTAGWTRCLHCLSAFWPPGSGEQNDQGLSGRVSIAFRRFGPLALAGVFVDGDESVRAESPLPFGVLAPWLGVVVGGGRAGGGVSIAFRRFGPLTLVNLVARQCKRLVSPLPFGVLAPRLVRADRAINGKLLGSPLPFGVLAPRLAE